VRAAISRLCRFEVARREKGDEAGVETNETLAVVEIRDRRFEAERQLFSHSFGVPHDAARNRSTTSAGIATPRNFTGSAGS